MLAKGLKVFFVPTQANAGQLVLIIHPTAASQPQVLPPLCQVPQPGAQGLAVPACLPLLGRAGAHSSLPQQE